jgi:hypothetical protein
MSQYAALSKSPRALADGRMLVFQRPAKESRLEAAPTGQLMLVKIAAGSRSHTF